MVEGHFGTYLVLIPNCMTEILAKECKSGKSNVLALDTVHQIGLECSCVAIGLKGVANNFGGVFHCPGSSFVKVGGYASRLILS